MELDISWTTIPAPDGLADEAVTALSRLLAEVGRGRRRIRLAPVCRPFAPHAITHFHQTPELFLQRTGTGTLELPEAEHPLEPGTLNVMPRGVPHEEHADPGPYRNLVFALHPDRVHFHLGIGGLAGMPVGRRRIISTHKIVADPRVGRIIGYFNEATAASLDAAQHLVAGLALAGVALLKEVIAEPAIDQHLDPLLEHARHILRTRLTEPELGAARIAELLGCNADHLSHRFSVATGRTLMQTITTERCELAARLLRDPAHDIAAVARTVGYRDPAYFSRVFRRHFGQSPRAWRKSQALR